MDYELYIKRPCHEYSIHSDVFKYIDWMKHIHIDHLLIDKRYSWVQLATHLW